MNQKFFAFILAIAASAVAVGTGAYLTLRGPQPTVSDVGSPQAGSEAPATSAGVAETEGIIQPPAEKDDPVGPGTSVAKPEDARPTPVATAPRPPAPRRRGQPTSRSGDVAQPPQSPAAERSGPPAERARKEPLQATGEVTPGPEPQVFGQSPDSRVTTEELGHARPAPVPALPQRVYEELTVPADSVVGLQIEDGVSSEGARVEDRVNARVSRDVRAGGHVAIPSGSRMEGSVTFVERGGKVKERARLGVRFHTLVLADGTRLPVQTDTIFREGESPVGGSTAKIGGAAIGGAILGAIIGGGKGAAIGGSIGAAGGTAAVMAGDRRAAELPAGSTVTVRLQGPVTVTVEK